MKRKRKRRRIRRKVGETGEVEGGGGDEENKVKEG